ELAEHAAAVGHDQIEGPAAGAAELAQADQARSPAVRGHRRARAGGHLEPDEGAVAGADLEGAELIGGRDEDERGERLVVDDALNWLASQPADKPVFLWVHLYDAHFPYEPHPEYDGAFDSRPYDGELAFVDDQVGRLVSAFEGRSV